jgi:PPOX class probable F420-dependent enzyme
MKLISHRRPADRERVEGRLRSNLIAWLTTVRPDGQPVTVPVWFLLRDDETILLYSRPHKDKLRNIAANPKVSFALDVTDIGRNVVRLEGTAKRAHDQPPANEHPAYLAKYTERMAAMFGTPGQFATRSSRPRSSSRRSNCIPEPTARVDRIGRPAHVDVVAQPGRYPGSYFRHPFGYAHKQMTCVPGSADDSYHRQH